MSVEYFLACKELPPFEIETIVTFPLVSNIVNQCSPEDIEELWFLEDIEDSFTLVLSFSGSTRLDWELILYFVQRLADLTEGDIFDGEGEFVYGGKTKGTVEADFNIWWNKHKDEFEKHRQAQANQKQQKYQDLRKNAPEKIKEANDWSDVDF